MTFALKYDRFLGIGYSKTTLKYEFNLSFRLSDIVVKIAGTGLESIQFYRSITFMTGCVRCNVRTPTHTHIQMH